MMTSSTCGVLDGLDACGAPADPRLTRMLGEPICVDHGEDKMKELMSE